jgi:hypothetical protein
MPEVDAEIAEAINAVLEELAEEVDGRYDNENLTNSAPAILHMSALTTLMRQAGHDTPQLCDDLAARLARKRN